MIEDGGASPVGNEDEWFAENVRALRERKGWSQGELARQLQQLGFTNFHQTTISRIEKGDRPVRLSEARGIAVALDTYVGSLVAPTVESEAVRDLLDSIALAQQYERQLRATVRDLLDERDTLAFLAERVRKLAKGDQHAKVLAEAEARILSSIHELVTLGHRDFLELVAEGADKSAGLRAVENVPAHILDAPPPVEEQ